MKTWLYLALFAISCPICVAFDQGQKDAAIRKMLETAGYSTRYLQEQPKFLAYIQKERPQASASDMKVLARHLEDKDFIGAMVPVVGAYLTQDDVEAVNAFLASDAGAKEMKFMLLL